MPHPGAPEPRTRFSREPVRTGTLTLLAPLPLTEDWNGRPYRFKIEAETVSGESRLLAVDVRAEQQGSYSAFLIARPCRRPALEARSGLRESRARDGLDSVCSAGSWRREGRGRCSRHDSGPDQRVAAQPGHPGDHPALASIVASIASARIYRVSLRPSTPRFKSSDPNSKSLHAG